MVLQVAALSQACRGCRRSSKGGVRPYSRVRLVPLPAWAVVHAACCFGLGCVAGQLPARVSEHAPRA